jgi:F-type H+-transporting ATPase subunit gamma
MTRRQELEHHRHSMGEIRGIMNSMKTLAYMETRKLTRFLDAQHAVVRSIEAAAEDLLAFYPETLPEATETTPVYLLVGTDRGFCGDFNHTLLNHLESALEAHPSDRPLLIAVGRKLHALLEDEPRVAVSIDGAGVAEDVDSVLVQVVNELTAVQLKRGVLALYGLYHGGDGIVMQKLLPPFQNLLSRPPAFPHPPLCNRSPRDLLVELTEHYLFALLHDMLYTSLIVENHYRLAHLDGAVRHLDSESAELAQRCNALRQEEIIEEIEVILLSAADLDQKGKKGMKS